jgi:hypothetical protein
VLERQSGQDAKDAKWQQSHVNIPVKTASGKLMTVPERS